MKPLIATIPERCRVCYTCVRECPAKAIRIQGGQAEVIAERCIGCGNCVRVCSQGAKYVRSSVADVEALLDSEATVGAIVAPSFVADIGDQEPARFVGALRALGFDFVNEVAFGADLVADRYRELILRGEKNRRYIATTCPAIVAYVSKYHPELVPNLTPIVSPMIATARVLRQMHGADIRLVFVGPCLAKKQEALDPAVAGEIDAVLTFHELRQLFARRGVDLTRAPPAEMNPPFPGLGQLFPLARGMLQAADMPEDLLRASVVAAEGREDFVGAIKEFAEGAMDARLLEILCCNGCILGAGMTTKEPLFRRRARVSAYARARLGTGPDAWTELGFAERRPSRGGLGTLPGSPIQRKANMDRFARVNLSRTFAPSDQRTGAPSDQEISAILARMGKRAPEDELNCGACGYETCREHAVAIHRGLAESQMCLPYTIDRLNDAVGKLADSHTQLVSTQQALMQSERLASMGQLAAGIAHELNNPLGVVLLYAHALLEEHGGDPALREDLRLVVEQADRCKSIVGGLLNFARRNKIARQSVCVPALVDRCAHILSLPEEIAVVTSHPDPGLTAEVDADQITQVLTNLVSNAVAAMPQGGTLTFSTARAGGDVVIKVADTGHGIPRENLSRIFEPFFTTKQMGKGTGLGLAVTYGIIKMHRGSITVESNADPRHAATGTVFTVRLPLLPEAEREPSGVLREDEDDAAVSR